MGSRKEEVLQAVAKGFSRMQATSMGTKLTVATIAAITDEIMDIPRNSCDIELSDTSRKDK